MGGEPRNRLVEKQVSLVLPSEYLITVYELISERLISARIKEMWSMFYINSVQKAAKEW